MKNRAHKSYKLRRVSFSIRIENEKNFSYHYFEMIIVIIELSLVKSDKLNKDETDSKDVGFVLVKSGLEL